MLTFLSLRHHSGHDRTVNLKASDLDCHFESAIDGSNLGTVPPHVCGSIINCPVLVHGWITCVSLIRAGARTGMPRKA